MAAAAGLPVSASFVPPVGAGTPAAGDDSLGASMGNIPPLDGTRVVDLTATATPRAPTGLPADLEAFLVAQDSEKPIPINRQFFVDISKKDAETVRDLYIQKRTLFNQLETLAITEGPLQALAEASLAAERAFDANKDQSRIEALSVICDDTATALNAAGNPCHLKYINADKEIYKFFKQMAQKSASYDHQAVGSVAKIWAHLEKEKGDETSKTAWREFLVLFGDVDLSLSELRIVTIAPPAAAASPPSPPPPSAPTLASLALPLLPPASPPTHPATASSPSTPPPALTHAAPTAASPPPSPTAPTSPVSREGSPPRTATPPPSAPAAAASPPSTPPPSASTPAAANPAPLTPASALPATPRVAAATTSASQPLPPVAPQVERRGFDKAVTTPVVGSLVAVVMLPVRTAQTVGYVALAIFQGLRNLFVKDISKEVEHKYGEKAIRAAKGMFVAVVAFIPLAGPQLAGLVLERWVDRRAAVKV